MTDPSPDDTAAKSARAACVLIADELGRTHTNWAAIRLLAGRLVQIADRMEQDRPAG